MASFQRDIDSRYTGNTVKAYLEIHTRTHTHTHQSWIGLPGARNSTLLPHLHHLDRERNKQGLTGEH